MSARAEFSWKIERDGFRIEGSGKYAVDLPDSVHLVTRYTGQGGPPQPFREANDSEVLALGRTVYVNAPSLSDGWVVFTPEQFGGDWDVTRRLLTARSPLDYAAIVNAAVGAAPTGNESIGGHTYWRYAATVDAGELMDALADAYGSQGQVMLANRFQGPVATTIWIDPVTQLPRRVLADGEFTFASGLAKLKLQVDFTALDSSPDIPAPPKNATPLDTLRG
jgi:hypothetical protein